jgi:hypothetical protein
MTSDPGPTAPAPGNNQPTWTTVNGRFGYWEPNGPEVAWVQKVGIYGCNDETEAKAIAELVAAVRDAQHLTAATAALHALHSSDGSLNPWCVHDGFAWPCPTIRALAETRPQ